MSTVRQSRDTHLNFGPGSLMRRECRDGCLDATGKPEVTLHKFNRCIHHGGEQRTAAEARQASGVSARPIAFGAHRVRIDVDTKAEIRRRLDSKELNPLRAAEVYGISRSEAYAIAKGER